MGFFQAGVWGKKEFFPLKKSGMEQKSAPAPGAAPGIWEFLGFWDPGGKFLILGLGFFLFLSHPKICSGNFVGLSEVLKNGIWGLEKWDLIRDFGGKSLKNLGGNPGMGSDSQNPKKIPNIPKIIPKIPKKIPKILPRLWEKVPKIPAGKRRARSFSMISPPFLPLFQGISHGKPGAKPNS